MAFPPDATLSDAGEFGLIEALTGLFEQGEHVLVGPGDDAAVLRVKSGHVVVSTDLMVEGRHFRRDWAPASDVGHRAAAQNLSDINAMGGRATSLTIGLAAPGDLPVQWALEFAQGFAEECAAVGASVVGGDLTHADQVVIAVTALGACTVAPVVRSGAQAGDVLALFGRQGWASGGLAVLGRGFRSPRVLVEAYRRPDPPYDAGQVAADAGATAMIDVSDGLLADADHIAQDSGVAIDVRRQAFEIPEPLHAVGAAIGADPVQFILGGGDDHVLLATFPEGSVPDGWAVIGSVSEGSGVTVDRIENGTLVVERVHPRAGTDGGGAAGLLEKLCRTPLRLAYPLLECELLRRRQARLVADIDHAQPARYAFAETMGWREYIAAPIVVEASVVGFLHGDRAAVRRALGQLDVDALEHFAGGFALVFERAVLRRRLRDQRREIRRISSWAEARTGELSDRAIDLRAGDRTEEQERRAKAPEMLTENGLATHLTARELDVLQLMAEGKTNGDIARALFVSEGTVKFHVKNILRKMQASNRADASSRYLRLTLPDRSAASTLILR